MSRVFSSCVPCDMLIRTPFAPASTSCSTISGSREAGPMVIKIFARLKVKPCRLMLRLGGLESGFDRGVKILASLWSKAEKSLDKLALTIEHERLRDAVVVPEQESNEIVVRLAECVLNAELLRELGDFLVIAWSTDVESDDDQSLVFILLSQPNQMRHAIATRNAPRRIEIQD